MIQSNAESKLIQEYDGIRFRESELITDFLEIISHIDEFDRELVQQVRDAQFHNDHPFLMVFVGPFSSGKSSLINALLGEKAFLPTGATPTTDHIHILRWAEETQKLNTGSEIETVFHPARLLNKVSLVDTPGLESVFDRHEETTRRFLHRSDVVFLVMLATQAMTASNLNYLQKLKTFGKKIIILINQSDLLSNEEQKTVQDYVQEQSRERLGLDPEIWMVSAKQGIEANQNPTRDEGLWKKSGLDKIEHYVIDQLDDVERLRQKLHTPLQIMQNTHRQALDRVQENLSTLDHYRSVAENADKQITSQVNKLDRLVKDGQEEVDDKFDVAIFRGNAAIHDIFQFSKALSSLWNGLTFGILQIFRRSNNETYVKSAFFHYNVFEAITGLSDVLDKLASRFEAADMSDIDELVQYGQREVKSLPTDMQGKIIGNIQPPLQYDRSILQNARSQLEDLEDQAKILEVSNVDSIVKNTLFYLVVWEFLIVVLLISVGNIWGILGKQQPILPFIVLLVILGLGVLGFALMPFRGRYVANSYQTRLLDIQKQYLQRFNVALQRQQEYSAELRQDSLAPLTQMIQAQVEVSKEQQQKLEAIEKPIRDLETDIASFGKKGLM